MNITGLTAALATFLGVWVGHVAVRRIEFISPTIWLPTTTALTLGVSLGALSVTAANRPFSVACGILAITLCWDALEFTRQQRRVRKGHAPANPANHRHARFLAEGRATPLDLLKREPVGRRVSADEAVQLVMEPKR